MISSFRKTGNSGPSRNCKDAKLTEVVCFFLFKQREQFYVNFATCFSFFQNARKLKNNSRKKLELEASETPTYFAKKFCRSSETQVETIQIFKPA